MEKVDIRTSSYFSLPFLLVGGVLSFCGLIVLIEGFWWVGFLLGFVSLLIFTTHYRLQLDLRSKTYHDYVWVLGWKVGEKGSFDAVDYVFLKRAKVSQTVHARVTSTTIKKEVYDAYLKFSNGETIHLLTKDSRKAVLRKLQVIAEKLQTTLVDYTQEKAKGL